jgi:hypothetical protein
MSAAVPPPGYEGTAARLVSEGVPAEIANDPNETAGLAAWLDRGDES